MTTLIDKLRAAETGSPELSAEVYAECCMPMTCRAYLGHHNKMIKFDPPLTESIDAALTLVPEAWVWSKSSDNYVMVSKKLGSRIIAGCHHKSLPIAICIAVLSSK